MKYFTDYKEYPKLSMEILPFNTLWAYIASTFLNGFINYPKPIRATLLGRYNLDDDEYENNIKKAELFNSIGAKEYHTNLNMGDDLLILSKIEKTNEYWFFHFDQDVSDCQIGRFKTDDSEEAIIKEFDRYINDLTEENNWRQPIELNPSNFRGWISF